MKGGVDSSGVRENGRREVLGEDLAEVADQANPGCGDKTGRLESRTGPIATVFPV